MENGQTNVTRMNAFVCAICNEYEEAKAKHPKFADGMMCPRDFQDASDMAELEKTYNDETVSLGEKIFARDLFDEEMWEAMEAYTQGDLDACLSELAQCAAVILRTMELVADERDAKEKEADVAD